MVLAEHFPQNGPLHFQANNIPALQFCSCKLQSNLIKNIAIRFSLIKISSSVTVKRYCFYSLIM